ncbi:MAG: hypothetical protein FJZ01_15740 [Candidatus Sericytochromatia bacterium]|nr:hypothetical protein [Candidatus Tanganyikabacteria bacterium]
MPNLRLTILGAALAATLAGCGKGPVAVGAFAGIGEGTVFAPAARAARNVSLFTQPDAGVAPVLDAIRGARKSVDLKVYIFTEQNVLGALKEAKARGVAVRVLMEREPFNPGNPGSGLPVNFAMAKSLKEAGITYRWTSDAFNFTHEKAMCIDNATAIIMTSNLTKGAFTKNREYGIIDREPADAAGVAQVFAADWDQRPTQVVSKTLVVSPDNSRSQLSALLESARKSIHVQDEVMGDPATFELLGKKARAGVDVRVQLGHLSGNADDDAKKALLAAGVTQVRVVSSPTMHAKMALVDGKQAYVGSINFTTNSIEKNREMGVIVDEPRTIASLAATAEKDWAAGKP